MIKTLRQAVRQMDSSSASSPELCTDVILYMFEHFVVVPDLSIKLAWKSVLRGSAVCHVWRIALASLRGKALEIDSWRWIQFQKLFPKRSSGEIYVHYEGFDYGTFWENYKMDVGIRVCIRGRVGGSVSNMQRLRRVGIVYTFTEWRDVHWENGPDRVASDSAWSPPKRPDLEAYRRPQVKQTTDNATDFDLAKFHEDEESWFYGDASYNGRLGTLQDQEIRFEFVFADSNWTVNWGNNINQGCHDCLSFCKHMWYALYAEDWNGYRSWDNNDGWNFVAARRKNSPGLLMEKFDYGWRGS